MQLLKHKQAGIIVRLICILFFIHSFTPGILCQGYLHRNGKYIYDGTGKEIILRGIGTGNFMLQEGYMMQTSDVLPTQHQFRKALEDLIGTEKTDSFYTVWLASHFREIDIDSMKSWGFNSIRLAMHYKWFTPPIEKEPVPGEITWLETGFVLVDSLLKWCEKHEMYLILDLHGAPGGQGKDAAISDYDASKPSLWESQLNKDKTIALWRRLAERYHDEPWIGGYDLINETNWSFPEGNNSKLRELMVNITNAIREVDQNHIIFIEGNGFANDFSGMTPPWDNNMAYSFHKYWSYNTQDAISFALNLRNSHNVPIWMGEAGENSNAWFTSAIELFERNRIGWSWWPVKKPGINNPLRVLVNSDYTQLINYWKGTASKPTVEQAFNAVLTFAENHRLENCVYQRDVVDAMIRQPHSRETLPYTLHRPGQYICFSDYDLGRNGSAWYDNDSANFSLNTGSFTAWNQGYEYRNDGVDIEKCTDTDFSKGYNVGWTGNGEWMIYSFTSDSAAAYTLQIRSASGSGGSNVHFEWNGTPITPSVYLPSTGAWQQWQTTEVQGIILPAGTGKLKLYFDKGGSNLNYFRFTDPKPVAGIPFKYLYSVSSADGKQVLVNLNKPVSSPESELRTADFNLTINSKPIGITSIEIDKNDQSRLIINVSEDIYYGGIIRLSYIPGQIESDGLLLSAFTNVSVVNNLPVRYNIPGRIQAENYAYNNGLVPESCSDTGGGLDMGYAAPGDYMDYRVYVSQPKYYTINVRVASERSSSQLGLRVEEGNIFREVGVVNITSTGGWQTWKTVSTEVFLKEGRYTLRLYVKSGEFNTNWFEAMSASGVHVEQAGESGIKVYPNPAGKYLIIESKADPGSRKRIELFNLSGHILRSVTMPPGGILEMDLSGFPAGYYLLKYQDQDGKPEVLPVIMTGEYGL